MFSNHQAIAEAMFFFSKSQGLLDGYNKYDREVEVITWK
jgi:hypothetical protein